jgi:pSer/pThr/pTyr-binding forkhead associated (FHA) protein
MYGVLTPRGGGEEIPLLKKKLLVGRRDSCDICINFANVSGKHCELELVNGYWQIRDLGSANGVRVNGERVDAKFLMSGDEVGFGRHYYTIAYTPLTAGPKPEDGVDLSVGLLRKAGLLGDVLQETPRPAHKRPQKQTPVVPPPPPPPANPDEDEAMKWLTGD